MINAGSLSFIATLTSLMTSSTVSRSSLVSSLSLGSFLILAASSSLPTIFRNCFRASLYSFTVVNFQLQVSMAARMSIRLFSSIQLYIKPLTQNPERDELSLYPRNTHIAREPPVLVHQNQPLVLVGYLALLKSCEFSPQLSLVVYRPPGVHIDSLHDLNVVTVAI